MQKCILCLEPLNGKEPPEHVWLDSLGGKLEVKGSLCNKCNNERMGNGPDKALSEDVAILRTYMNFKSGKRRRPPTASAETSYGEPFKLLPGAIPQAISKKPFDVKFHEDGTWDLIINARDMNHIKQLVPHIAAKVGVSESEVKRTIKKAASNGQTEHTSCPVGKQGMDLSLGGTLPIRSMVKSALVLWMHKVGNIELQNERYDFARQFALNGDDETCRTISRLDLRPLPVGNELEIDFGNNVNLFYVCSDVNGRVLGHFRLYNATAWCLEICTNGAPKNWSIGMAFNPFDPGKKSEDIAQTHPITFNWIDRADFNDGFEHVAQTYGKMLDKGHHLSATTAIENAVEEVFSRYGFSENDPVPHDLLNIINLEISNKIANILHKMPSVRFISPEEFDALDD